MEGVSLCPLQAGVVKHPRRQAFQAGCGEKGGNLAPGGDGTWVAGREQDAPAGWGDGGREGSHFLSTRAGCSAEKAHGSTLCQSGKVGKRDLISTARGQAEGRLALYSPAQGPVGGTK